MGSPDAFHQLAVNSPQSQTTQPKQGNAPPLFPGYILVPGLAPVPATTSPLSTVTTTQSGPAISIINVQQSSPHSSASSDSPQQTEEDEAEPLVSALSFSTAQSKPHAPLLSVHVSACIL